MKIVLTDWDVSTTLMVLAFIVATAYLIFSASKTARKSRVFGDMMKIMSEVLGHHTLHEEAKHQLGLLTNIPKGGLLAFKRVGVIYHSTRTQTDFIGYGDFVGVEDYPESKEPMKTAKIHMDSGEYIWGIECWWDSAEKVERFLKGKTIVQVTVAEVRGKFVEMFKKSQEVA